MREFYSSYVGMGNNPINLTDPTGGVTNGGNDGDPIKTRVLDGITVNGRQGFFGRLWSGIRNFFGGMDYSASGGVVNSMSSMNNYGGITYFGKYGSRSHWEREHNQFNASMPFDLEWSVNLDFSFKSSTEGEGLIGGFTGVAYNSRLGTQKGIPTEGYLEVPVTSKVELRYMPRTQGVRVLYTPLPALEIKSLRMSLKHQYDGSIAFKTGDIKLGQRLNASFGNRKIGRFNFGLNVIGGMYFISTPQMRQSFLRDLNTTYIPPVYRE